jgi:hypothetical protein
MTLFGYNNTMTRTCEMKTSKRDPYRLPPNIDTKPCGRPAHKQGEAVCLYHIKLRNNQLRKRLAKQLGQGQITKEYYQEALKNMDRVESIY